MAPKFGTSGLRGLVTELTDELIAAYTRAFLSACPVGRGVYVGQDLRPSSPRIAAAVIAAARGQGVSVVDCGIVPTPALALASMAQGAAAIMVTGSHIPADRNGLKFYVPDGEISKEDEEAILSAYQAGVADLGLTAALTQFDATPAYIARYRDGFGDQALSGLRVGVYQHSSVSRDVMVDVVAALGGVAVPLARSEVFVPVDTEAVDQDTRNMLRDWCTEHRLDAVISTDGDADRPMVTDSAGRVIPGDILGVLTARLIGAKVIATPVSSNSMLQQIEEFDRVELTRIGSPYVIAAMEAALETDPAAQVTGFEPNGGFLVGFAATGLAGPIAPLMTRDSILPIVAPLAAARAAGQGIADLVAGLPPRFTAADRVTETPTDASAALLARLMADTSACAAFFAEDGEIAQINLTDGLRVLLASGRIVHLRPSGNAPEFRVYAEAEDEDTAWHLVRTYMAKVRQALIG